MRTDVRLKNAKVESSLKIDILSRNSSTNVNFKVFVPLYSGGYKKVGKT